MLTKYVNQLIHIFDNGDIIKKVLFISLKIIGILIMIQGVIGGIYFFLEAIQNEYLSSLNKITAVILSILYIALLVFAGNLYTSRANRFKQLIHRGLIDQWITITRYSVELTVVLILGGFFLSTVATFISGSSGVNLNMYLFQSSFHWLDSFVDSVFSRDSEVLIRLFSFFFLLIGIAISWGIYYSSNFFLEVIDTADRFFKRESKDT